ncbi:uncharacterized protein [Lepeophtheirus salmonis]|uniref:uncharacterized protein n=1 Tax=Lepeophtheirus salmonis TaxID=72036 RepID=UPI001AE72C0B|nr:cuticle protein 7-like [Lepeophtheirus salmonis]
MFTNKLLAFISLTITLSNAVPQIYYKPISSSAPTPSPIYYKPIYSPEPTPAPPAPAQAYGPYPPPSPPPSPSPPVYSPYGSPSPPAPPPAPPVNYGYTYSVLDAESGVDISADEQADNGAVSGSYKVALPDGRIKTVTYTVVGESGFVADVQYEAAPVSLAPASSPYPTYVPYSF